MKTSVATGFPVGIVVRAVVGVPTDEDLALNPAAMGVVAVRVLEEEGSINEQLPVDSILFDFDWFHVEFTPDEFIGKTLDACMRIGDQRKRAAREAQEAELHP